MPGLRSGLELAGVILVLLSGEFVGAQPPKELSPPAALRLWMQARRLSSQAATLESQGKYVEAVKLLEQVLEIQRTLYPSTKYPNGHLEVATALNELGALLWSAGEVGKALAYLEQALAMCRSLYPPEKYPDGHEILAAGLNNLGVLLESRGEYLKALPHYEQALAMRQKLYPADKYPDGSQDLADSLQNLGHLLDALGQPRKGLPYCKQALSMYEKLFPQGKYPKGDPILATSLNNLGAILESLDEYDKALPYYERGLAMRRKLYPDPHPDVADSLNNIGHLFSAKGNPAKALTYYTQALQMREKLYPSEKYPTGHSDLVDGLSNMAVLLDAMGQSGKALPYAERALTYYQKQVDAFIQGAAEAEGLRFLHHLPRVRDTYLGIALHQAAPADEVYARLWAGRSAVSRVMERRHLAVLATTDRPEIRESWCELTEVRRQINRLRSEDTDEMSERVKRQRELTSRKERLERELAERLPAIAQDQALDRLGPSDLRGALPRDAVFLDFLRYARFEQDPKVPGKKGQRRTLHYVAFIVTNEKIERVELGEAGPIEEDLETWQGAIAAPRDDAVQAEQVRRLVWEPMAKFLSAPTTVYISPDGALQRLPWVALPGDKPGTVLLEQYAFALVPHSRYLLARLRQRHPQSHRGPLLALGGIAYDDRPVPPDDPRTGGPGAAHPRERMSSKFRSLRGSEREIEYLQRLGSEQGLIVRPLRGSRATTDGLLAELPRARLAHLSTHGYFDDRAYRDEQERERRQIALWEFQQGEITALAGSGARNPLSFAGLVLAGANKPAKAGLDGGILTGEILATLPLDRLDLAVLSACQTGLGPGADGQCSHTLQWAFHVAGCQNVVASLWNVPDQPTAALMAVFYDRLLREKRTPLQALREAQLVLLRHPQRLVALADDRAPNFSESLKLPAEPMAGEPKVRPGRGAVKAWAGFVLSGLGE
jgi:CHAT domain-containing protein